MPNSSRSQTFFNVAKAVSKTSDHPEFQLGSVIASGKSIVAVGANRKAKSHPLQKQYNEVKFHDDNCKHPLHAEIDALRKIDTRKQYSNLSIYIFRQTKKGKPAIARPCKACMEAIKDFGIHHIYYSTDMGFAHEVLN